MEVNLPESNNSATEARNQSLLEEVEGLKLQLEDAKNALEQNQTRLEGMAEMMVHYRELWKNTSRENELLRREVPSDADYPCYSQTRPEERSSPFN
jgi:hypothetical protein